MTNSSTPELEPTITQVIHFADESLIFVIVKSPPDSDGSDEARQAYYNMLLPVLDEIEFPDDD